MFALACLLHKHYIKITPLVFLCVCVLQQMHFQLGNNLTRQMIRNRWGWGHSVEHWWYRQKQKARWKYWYLRMCWIHCYQQTLNQEYCPLDAPIQGHTLKKSVARWSFSLGVVWWPGSLTTQRMSRGRGFFFFLGHSRVDGDYMLRHRNDNNREQAAAQIQLALCLG